ncbi:Oxidoreductase [Asimina triloba]
MGQAQSDSRTETQITEPSSVQKPQPSSLEDLIAEAAAFGDDENESLDAKVQKALECPCVAGLRSGPCGTQFSEAFVCFLKSTAEEKGSDCVSPFVALQNCIKANPGAFSKDVFDGEESKEEDEVVQEYKIIPPSWSKESKTKH